VAVVIVTTLPPEANRALDEGVAKELDTVSDPPQGMIVHTASEANGRVTIIDVWESKQAFEKFEKERLLPAIQKVSGMDPSKGRPLDRTIYEAYRLERGVGA